MASSAMGFVNRRAVLREESANAQQRYNYDSFHEIPLKKHKQLQSRDQRERFLSDMIKPADRKYRKENGHARKHSHLESR